MSGIGTVRALSSRGFGFVRPLGNNHGDGDVFFHFAEVGVRDGELQNGDQVQYESQVTLRGLRATSIKRAQQV
jgi:cold shock CspA family protein